MNAASFRIERPQTRGEEVANSISHGIGFVLAVAALPVLVSACVACGGQAINVVAVCVFAATMLLLYGSSTLFHALPAGRAKQVFNKLDHAAIYLFIAGSYTLFALGALHGGWGWALFGVVWGLAVLGTLAKLFNRLRRPLWSTGLYVSMGWLVVAAAVPLIERVSSAGLILLVVGGLLYTLGAVVFLFDSRVRYAHLVWHLFVMGGSACHVFPPLRHAQ